MTQVLIVDDNDANLYLLRTMLAGQHYEVVEARHGAEALTKARQRPPAVVVSDLLMPVMDGYALLRQWKSDDRLAGIPFIVYTATYTDAKDERLALDLGADAFVVKPAEPEAFMAVMQEVLAGRGPARRPTAHLLAQDASPSDYTDVVVRKLEKKAFQLEQANRELLAEVAERRQTELALHDSEQRYRSLFMAIADPLFVYDRETLKYLAVNAAAVQKYGYSRDEFLGMTIKDIRPVEDIAALLDMLDSAGTGPEHRGVWRHCKRDGSVIEVEISAHGLQYGGRPACVIQARDVTEKRRIEAEAARTHDLLRAVTDSVSDAVFAKDRSGKYLLFNKAASQFVGRDVADVLGRDDTALFDADSARLAMEGDRLVMESNSEHLREEVLTAAGVTRVYEALKAPYRDASGNVLGVVGVSRDITDRRQAEEATRHQQALLRIAGRVARIGGWSVDLTARRVTWSDEVCAIHEEPPGFQPALDDAIHYYLPEHRQHVAEAVAACATDGTPFDFEAELVTAHGHRIWVRSIGEAVRSHTGAITSVQGAFQDITDRKRAEDAQRQLAERLTATLESITDGFFTVDHEWRFTYVNAEAERLFQRSRLALNGRSLWDVFPETRGLAFEREYRRAIEHNITVEFEEYFEQWATWFGVRAYPSELGLAVYFRDVTASREAEQALRLSEERFRLLSRATSDVVWEWDIVTGAHAWNEGVTTLFGYTPDEIEPVVEFCTERIHPDDAERVTATVRRAIESGASNWSAEYRFRRRDGGYTPILDSGYIIRDAGGRPVRMLGGMKDLTARHQIEESLLLRERAIQAVSEGIVITDVGQADNPVVFVSGGFERMTGYPAEEVIGQNCRFLQGPDTDPETVKELASAIAAARNCSAEILNYRKDGRPFWNKLSISPVFSPAGRLTHFVGVQTDVTDRRRLEEQYRQAQKMEAVGRLAGGVAHDFNNLLTIISGYSELLLSTPDLDAVVRESVVSISEAGEQAASLTRQLLGFSRQSMLQPKVIDLNALVARTSGMLRRLIGEDVLLTTVLDPKLSPVKVDPSQMDQVLMNLAVNARDAMPRGGKLTLETSNVLLDEDFGTAHLGCRAGPHVMLAISDTGSGMTPDVKARIFEPFFTTKGVGKGTGLGLAMVFGVVEQSGGCIRVYSEPGLGSTFRIYLPVAYEALPAGPGQLAHVNVRGTETILLVEDEDGVRGLASMSLRLHGYRVLTATDGKDALRVVKAHRGPLHLLLTDVVMPNLSGPQVAAELQSAVPGLKVLFMSGYTDDAVVRHGMIEADIAYIQKPFTPLGLLRKVREVLGGAASGG